MSKSLKIIQLSDLLEMYDDSVLVHELGKFQCTKNADVEHFLHENSLTFEKAAKSRTYLAVTTTTLQVEEVTLEITGYFTLALKHLTLDEEISRSKLRKVNGLFIPDNNVVVGFLIGQLGKSDQFKDQISGKQLLDAAQIVIRNTRRLIGGRFIIVECIPKTKLIEFYHDYGFELIQYDQLDGMAQLVYFL